MNLRKLIKESSFVCSLFVLLWSCQAQEKKNGVQEFKGRAFGTTYTVKCDKGITSKHSIDSILNEFNSQFSTYQKETQLSCYNLDNDPGCFSREGYARFTYLKDLSEEVNQESQGAFDPTAAPLFELWGFGKNKQNRVPSEEEINLVLQQIGWDKVQKGKRHILNFNAVAKGYAVDVLCQYLLERNARNLFVEIGGEVRCKGVNEEGNAWRIGINTPTLNGNQNDFLDIIEVEDGAVATSGNYRQFFVDENGNRLGHTIDPRIGKPVMNELLSATILAPDCAKADAYATACMVLGLEKSKAMVESKPEISALFVVRDSMNTFKSLKVGRVKSAF